MVVVLVGEQGMVDEAQKALEEAEALKKVANSCYFVHLKSVFLMFLLPASLSSFFFTLLWAVSDKVYDTGIITFILFNEPWLMDNLFLTLIISWRHVRSHLQTLLNIPLLMFGLWVSTQPIIISN